MAKEKIEKGTHYEPRKTEQRSYFLPLGLGDAFKESNHGNGSTGARGAFLLWMACEEFPALRDAAIRAAENLPIADAKQKIRDMLVEEVGLKAINEWVRSLPETKRARILARARQER